MHELAEVSGCGREQHKREEESRPGLFAVGEAEQKRAPTGQESFDLPVSPFKLDHLKLKRIETMSKTNLMEEKASAQANQGAKSPVGNFSRLVAESCECTPGGPSNALHLRLSIK